MSDDRVGTRRRGRRWPKGSSLEYRLPPVYQLRKTGSKKPVHDAVYEHLRSSILHGQVAPGAWLRQDQLTKALGVSRTPVREALRSLSQEGLVELMPNYGARVSPLSMDEFEELYALRGGIEGLAARVAVKSLTVEQLTELKNKYSQLEQLAVEGDLSVYLREEWLFRLCLYEASGRESLVNHIKSLRERAERYLRLAYGAEGRVGESLDFHLRLLRACERGDSEEAEKIVQAALRWTLEKAGPIIAEGIEKSE